MGRSGDLIGFEFHFNEAVIRRLQDRGDEVVIGAYLKTLMTGVRLTCGSKAAAYLRLPSSWLAHGRPEVDASGWFVGLEDDCSGAPAAEALAAWRALGARIGWRPGGAAAGTAPDFWVTARDDEARDHSVRGPWVAPARADLDQLEQSLRAGALWASCTVRLDATTASCQRLQPQARKLLRLLRQLTLDADTTDVVHAIKADAALSLRMLQYLNSASFAHTRALDSIEQAVTRLGRRPLYEWLSALLMRIAPARPGSEALQALALARGRLLEALAQREQQDTAATGYLLGLLSVMPPLMQVSVQDALDSVDPPPEVRQALLSREGPWAPHLDLLEALEQPDMAAAEFHAERFGGLDAVMAESARAWAFSPA